MSFLSLQRLHICIHAAAGNIAYDKKDKMPPVVVVLVAVLVLVLVVVVVVGVSSDVSLVFFSRCHLARVFVFFTSSLLRIWLSSVAFPVASQ